MNAAATDVAARRMNRAAIRAEARRLRTEDPTLPFQQIGDRLGISMAAAWKYARDIPRPCATCGDGFTPERRGLTTCPGCREARATAAREEKELRAAARAALACDDCGTELLVAARACGFCMSPDEFDLQAALAALDNAESPAVTGLSTTRREAPR